MGDRQSVEALQWLAYIGQTKDHIITAGNGWQVHLPGVPNVKVEVYSPETKEVFAYLGCFWRGCPCVPNRHKSIGTIEETMLTRFEKRKARLEKLKIHLCSCFDLGVALKMNFVCTLS